MAETKTRSIILKAEEVRAILDGRKTQVRRVVAPSSPLAHSGIARITHVLVNRWERVTVKKNVYPTKCPYGIPGDRLWVKEAFYIDLMPYDRGPLPKTMPAEIAEGHPAGGSWLYYRADGECCQQIPECCCAEYPGKTPWRPSIHMSRWASRLTLEVTDVRVERVRDITNKDVYAEGFWEENCESDAWGDFLNYWVPLYVKPCHGNDANPWVWAITFKHFPASVRVRETAR